MSSVDHALGPQFRFFGVSKRFGANLALSNLSLEIERGEWLYVTGPSGAGKSTFLKLFYLGEKTTSGEILAFGANMNRLSQKDIPFHRRRFGIIFQDFKLIANRSVMENVALVLEARGEAVAMAEKRAKNMLRHAGMEKRMHAMPQTLSGGEQQRVAVARAIAGQPEVILADEPTGSLDPRSADIIINLLSAYHQRGATVVVATHDRELMAKKPARVIQLDEGRLVASGAGGAV
ncbi:MAG: ATP-binding cassette domain-containing protein [Desulfobacterales bacterium]|nr:ATP-binding cassette domain-containing protein [Desulfobacterales bacterium]